MLTITDIKNLYLKYEVSASKRFGQNFLIDHNVLKNIIKVSKAEGEDTVEIGPGLGSLTLPLLDKVKSLSSYEIDKDMIRVLDGEINNDIFTLLNQDFLTADFNWKNRKVIVANIPYYITSDIIFKIFKNGERFSRATLMIQKEVAQRLVAPIGTKNYGKLTLAAQIFADDINMEFIVKPTCFIPSPKVDSAIITFNLKSKLSESDLKLNEFVKKCFAQRRKTLYNNLKLFNEIDSIKPAILKAGLKENARPQEVSLNQFKIIYQYLFN